MPRVLRICLFLAYLLVVVSCADSASTKSTAVKQFSGSIFGTTYSVKYLNSALSAAELSPLVAERLQQIDQVMSTWNPQSELSLLNAAPSDEWHEVSPELAAIIQQSRQISAQTRGAFDISAGPLVNIWGFGPDGRVTNQPNKQEINAARQLVGNDKYELAPTGGKIYKNTQIYLDLSAIAKGYAVDEIADLLAQQGINDYLVEIGGEIKTGGSKANQQPWRLAIESPLDDRRRVQQIFEPRGMGVATSGDYRNYFADQNGTRFSHIIDPATGYPIKHNLLSVTVLHPQTSVADALATAFMVMGTDKAYNYARANDLAIFLISKKADKIVELSSTAFAKHIILK